MIKVGNATTVPDDVTLRDATALHPMIGQTFPLERASKVRAAIGARTTSGKPLIKRENGRFDDGAET